MTERLMPMTYLDKDKKATTEKTLKKFRFPTKTVKKP